MFADDAVQHVCRGEISTGVGTGSVEGRIGGKRIESVKSKDRAHVFEWNAIRIIKNFPSCHIQIFGKRPAEQWRHECMQK